MDKKQTKKLNKQAIWFAIFHTILILDIIIEFSSFH